MHFLDIIKQLLFYKTVKYKAMYGVFSQIEALLSLKNAWLPPNFIFGYLGPLLSSAFSA